MGKTGERRYSGYRMIESKSVDFSSQFGNLPSDCGVLQEEPARPRPHPLPRLKRLHEPELQDTLKPPAYSYCTLRAM